MGQYSDNPSLASYTTEESEKLHRSFGHPSVNSQFSVLKLTRPEEVDKRLRSAIEGLVNRCRICKKTAKKPRRFKLTVGTELDRFNHTIAIDIMYIDSEPVVNNFDESTYFYSSTICNLCISPYNLAHYRLLMDRYVLWTSRANTNRLRYCLHFKRIKKQRHSHGI